MDSAARELRGVLIQELKQLEKVRTYDELRTQVSDIAVMLAKRMRDAIVDDMDFAYRNGYSSAYGEIKGINKTAAKAPDLKPEDMEVLRLLKTEGALYNAYNQFQNILVEKMNAAIMAGIAQGSSIPEIVQSMRQVGIGETYKLTRIARTEITQIANEGRLRGYKRAEGRMGIQFKYSLIIGKDTRTCPAHQELDSRIPSSGMYLNDLIMLQQEVGSKYRMNLRGHSLLHPNQRTSLVRIV
jgi:soluble cytochrome b562